jgi:RNA polymerase sigma-70 factor, ECF subfamily
MTVSTDDRTAFTELFEEHRHGVHAYLLARTSDAEVAHDLLQETFLRVWRRVGEVASLEAGRQRGWIYTVARNLVIDRYRAEATRTAAVAAVIDETRRAEAAAPDASDRAVARDQLASVHRAIGDLPEELRVVLTMAVIGEMTSAQIGEALAMPAGTVRYRLHAARRRVAAHLEGR